MLPFSPRYFLKVSRASITDLEIIFGHGKLFRRCFDWKRALIDTFKLKINQISNFEIIFGQIWAQELVLLRILLILPNTQPSVFFVSEYYPDFFFLTCIFFVTVAAKRSMRECKILSNVVKYFCACSKFLRVNIVQTSSYVRYHFLGRFLRYMYGISGKIQTKHFNPPPLLSYSLIRPGAKDYVFHVFSLSDVWSSWSSSRKIHVTSLMYIHVSDIKLVPFR